MNRKTKGEYRHRRRGVRQKGPKLDGERDRTLLSNRQISRGTSNRRRAIGKKEGKERATTQNLVEERKEGLDVKKTYSIWGNKNDPSPKRNESNSWRGAV